MRSRARRLLRGERVPDLRHDRQCLGMDQGHVHGPHQSHTNGDTAAVAPPTRRHDTPMVIKGGSFLCSRDYCVRYRASSREQQEADLGASHIGFRTILRDAS